MICNILMKDNLFLTTNLIAEPGFFFDDQTKVIANPNGRHKFLIQTPFIQNLS